MPSFISIYEEPGVLVAVRPVLPDSDTAEQAAAHLKGGLEQGRKVLALVENTEDPSDTAIYPQAEPSQADFASLAEQVKAMLGEGKIYDAVFLMESAMRGPHVEDPEVWMLAASVYELVKFHSMALPLLEKALPVFDERRKDAAERGVDEEAASYALRKSAVELRLSRALARSGRRDDRTRELIISALTNKELPEILKVEGLLIKAMTEPREEALETLDQLLDEAEEHLGDHRLAAEALELHADHLTESDASKAQQFYLAAGKMLLRLQDPYFFNLNERLVVHHLRNREMQNALALSQEMFDLLKQTGGPAVSAIPFLVFASFVHQQAGDQGRAEAAKQMANEIDANEAARVEANLRQALSTPVNT